MCARQRIRAITAANIKVPYAVTLGEYDFLIVADAPSEKDMFSVLLVGAGTGSVANLNTSLAWTTAEAMDAFSKAQALVTPYRPAGRA